MQESSDRIHTRSETTAISPITSASSPWIIIVKHTVPETESRWYAIESGNENKLKFNQNKIWNPRIWGKMTN
jgi:hypothetical protein